MVLFSLYGPGRGREDGGGDLGQHVGLRVLGPPVDLVVEPSTLFASKYMHTLRILA